MGLKRDKFDIIVSNITRKRERNCCESCNKTYERTECAHIFGRRHRSVRWDLDNVLCLCHGCHRKYTENPVDFTRFLERYIGVDELNSLRIKAWQVKKWTKAEKAALYDDLKATYAALESPGS